MNINFTNGTEKTDSAQQAAASNGEKSKDAEKEKDTSFYSEYQLLLLQNGISIDDINSGMLMSVANPQFEMLNGAVTKSGKTEKNTNLKALKTDFNYDTLTISRDDAMFFDDVVKKADFSVATTGDFRTQLLKAATEETSSTKSTEVSKSLLAMIETAQKTQKPMRIDFDNNVSVILRIDKSGKLSAEFVPSDKAVEQYLRNNIGYLKQSFDEQEIAYNDITYRPYKDGNKKKQQQQQGG